MRARKFIKLQTFCEKYDAVETTVRAHIKKMPKDAVITIGNRETYIDESYFVRRREFKLRVQHESQELYYFFSEHFADLDIARVISKKLDSKYDPLTINMFFKHGLFKLQEDLIVTYKIGGVLWNVWRALRWLVMRTFNAARRYYSGLMRYGLTKSVSRINDKRMEAAA